MTTLHNLETAQKPERLIPVGAIEVLSETETADLNGRPYTKRRVRVGDESDPTIRQIFHEQANADEQALLLHPEWERPYLDETGKLIIDPRNEAARRLYLDENGHDTQMVDWARHLKKASALEPLQNLSKGGRFLFLRKLQARTLELFTNMPDGIGLRSRQRIYSQLLEERAILTHSDTLKVVSLGSGAAVPNIQATEAIEKRGKRVEWTFYDLDPEALEKAEEMIASSGIQHSSFDYGPTNSDEDAERTGNKYTGRSYLAARELENESLDAVDALGLWEYLTDNQAVTFLKTLYPKLKPGATMIVSNMLKSRPHPEYNKRAVGWPDLHLRDTEDMLRIVEAAGIPTSNVRLTFSEDGVYVVMEIKRNGESSDS